MSWRGASATVLYTRTFVSIKSGSASPVAIRVLAPQRETLGPLAHVNDREIERQHSLLGHGFLLDHQHHVVLPGGYLGWYPRRQSAIPTDRCRRIERLHRSSSCFCRSKGGTLSAAQSSHWRTSAAMSGRTDEP